MSNNFRTEQEKIKNFLTEDIIGVAAREVAKGAAKSAAKEAAKSAAKSAAKTAAKEAGEQVAKAGIETVAAPVAAAAEKAVSTEPKAATVTTIPPELEPILRPRSKPEDKPEIKPDDKSESKPEAVVPGQETPSWVDSWGLPLLGKLLGLKLGFNPFAGGQPQPQSKSETGTKTKTATATKTKESDLTGPDLLSVPRGSSTPQYAYSSTNFAQETSPVFQREVSRNKVAEDLNLADVLRKKTILNLLSEEDIKSLEPSISGPRSPQAARMQERSLSTMSTPDTRKNRANAIQRMKDAIAAMNVETPKPTINPKYAGMPISEKSKKIPATKKILQKPS